MLRDNVPRLSSRLALLCLRRCFCLKPSAHTSGGVFCTGVTGRCWFLHVGLGKSGAVVHVGASWKHGISLLPPLARTSLGRRLLPDARRTFASTSRVSPCPTHRTGAAGTLV